MDDFINQLSGVMSAFDAGTLLGLIALVNVLTNLTKVPRVREWVPRAARKWVALGLGVASGALSALVEGKPLLAALLQGVIVGFGAIGTHEVTAPMVTKMRKNPGATTSIILLIGFGFAVASNTGCGLWKNTKQAAGECAKPEIKDVIAAFIPVALALVDKLMDRDGAVDWDAFANSTKASGWDGAVCLYDETVNRFLMARAKAGPSPTPVMDPDLQKELAAEARAKAWPGGK